MASHRYRVTKTLPWIDGGHPGPNFDWIGGRPRVYAPGDTIVVDDRAVPSIVHCLDGTDDAGRALVARVWAAIQGPATRRMLSAFHPKDRAWLIRATDEQLRKRGCMQDLVMRMLGRGDHPSATDVATALRPDEPVPALLRDYIVETYILKTKARPPGPKAPKRTITYDLAIRAHYQYELEQARQAYSRDNRKSRRVATVAKQATARAFSISPRTVERVVALRSSNRKRPPV